MRFPLRTNPSKLSHEIYTVDKLRKLLTPLKEEAKYLVLFLRSVCSIEVFEILPHGEFKCTFKVCIDECDYQNRIKQQKIKFVKDVELRFTGDSAYSTCHVIKDTANFSIEITDGNDCSKHKWLVVNQVGSQSHDVLQVAQSQHVLPWVGVAFEVEKATCLNDDGRIFCVLPLPMEDRAPLSVHVNGTFAISSNRRSLKWESQERKGDEESKWNRLLVEHCFPTCLYELVTQLTELYSNDPSVAYGCWPDIEKVEGTPWNGLLQPFYQLMLHSNQAVYTPSGGKWIKINEGIFIWDSDIPQAVQDAVVSCRVNLVKLNEICSNALSQYYGNVTELTPALVKRCLKGNICAYNAMSSFEKYSILEYCLSDNLYYDLVGLELLPLLNGSFCKFIPPQNSSAINNVYISSDVCPSTLLPDLKHILVNCSGSLQNKLTQIAKKGNTQLKILNMSFVADLLQYCQTSSWSNDQLSDFWHWLSKQQLHVFHHKVIVPVKLDNGLSVIKPLAKQIGVVYLNVSQYYQSAVLLSGLKKCGIKFASVSDFPYLLHSQLQQYLYQFTPNDILDALECFNLSSVGFSEDEATALQEFLCNTSLSKCHIACALPIFRVIQNNKLYSINSLKATNGACFVQFSYNVNSDLLPTSPLLLHTQENNGRFLTRLQATSNVHLMSEIDYFENVVFKQIQSNQLVHTKVIAIMQKIFQWFDTLRHSNNYHRFLKFKNAVSSLPFIETSPYVFQAPQDLFDPENSLLKELFSGKPKFPSSNYNAYLPALRECGLKSLTSVTAADILEIVKSIQQNSNNYITSSNEASCKQVKATLSYLCQYPMILEKNVSRNTTLLNSLTNNGCCWLPVVSEPPQQYPSCISWRGSNFSNGLVSSRYIPLVALTGSVISSQLPMIVGSQAIFIEHVPHQIAQYVNSSQSSLVKAVVSHFKEVIRNEDDIESEILEHIAFQTYTYLQNNISYCTRDVFSGTEQWIWLEKYSTFVSPTQVAITPCSSFRTSLEPFQFVISSRWQRFADLFTMLGIAQQITVAQIQNVLCQDLTRVTSDEAWTIVKSILHWTVEDSTRINDSILVPVESDEVYPVLQPIFNVSYTDNEMLRGIANASDEEFTLIHPKVAYLAPHLRLSPLSDHLDITEEVFEDAGQHEPLTTRLRNILKEYKDGLTIIKEMIQNADDAEATEVNILYDSRTHTTQNLILKGMGSSHGPALIVHNNRTFSCEDFENITKLAGATKSNKPLKIGKFGVGFCSVYHITDIPSFVSGEWVYIFDPTLQCLKGIIRNENQPGKKMKYMSKFLAKSHQLAPYENLFGFNSSAIYNGTMFRFPFRTTPSEISSTRYNEQLVSQLKKDLIDHGSKLLLFLQNVKRITFSSIRNNTPVLEISVECSIDRDFKKCVTKCINSASVTEHWLISNHNDVYGDQPGTASVACQLLRDEHSQKFSCKKVDGQLFCFLPLSVPGTGLPIHISANFAVMNNRSGIWTTSSHIPSDSREQWNQTLIQTAIPSAYCNLLLKLKQMYLNGELYTYEFYTLWPLDAKLQMKQPWQVLNSHVYNALYQHKLLYSSSAKKWLTFSESKFLSHSLFTGCDLLNEDISCINEAVAHLNLTVVSLPECYLLQLKAMITADMYIEQEAFVETFLSNVVKLHHCIDTRNKVLLHILSWVAIQTHNNYTLINLLNQYPCIPCSPIGLTLKLACELLDPNIYSDMFDSDNEMFPLSTFIENSFIYNAMVVLGLLRSNIPSDIIISCAETIESLFCQDEARGLKRIKLLISCIGKQYDDFSPNDKLALSKIPFLPVLGKPETYLLPWKGDGYLLLPPCELIATSQHQNLWKLAVTVGSQKAIANTDSCGPIPHKVLSLLDIQTKPSLGDVLSHFERLIHCFHNEISNDSETLKHIEQICRNVYEYLNNELQLTRELTYRKQIYTKAIMDKSVSKVESTITVAKQKLCDYNDKPFIWTGNSFALPCDVAKNWKSNNYPYLFKLPDMLSERKQLLEVLQVKERFDIYKLLSVFSKMQESFNGQQISSDYHEFCDEIILELNRFTINNEDTEYFQQNDVVLVDQTYILQSATCLSYNDAPWLPAAATDNCCFVHKKLNRATAIALGVKPTKTKYLDQFMTESSQKFLGVPFGQREELTDRIKNILRDYPLDVTLLKELIQNADDAKATRMCVILDKRTHRTDRILSEEWKELQGPALIIWDDKDFTDKDLEGIQKLGVGSKRDDEESIGQFGIGFNVVYHITDCPSFITRGNMLCVFDPHCRYVPGAKPECPGRLYDKLDQSFWTNMSDLYTAYLRDDLPNKPPGLNSGVLFRFPLRCTKKQVLESKLINDPITYTTLTADRMENYLKYWIPTIKDALLFLNNLTQLDFYVINESSTPEYTNLASFSVSLTDEHSQRRSSMKQILNEFRTSKQCRNIIYPLSIISHGTYRRQEEQWLIQQGVGDISNPSKQWIFLKRILPKHGIAAPLHKPHTLKGQVFCFLPLPEYTGLSVHINGQFALSSNRRSLWNSTTLDDKAKWNNDLIEAIAHSYAQFLLEARCYYISKEGYENHKSFYSAVNKYYSLFPFWNPPFEINEEKPIQQPRPCIGYSLGSGITTSISKRKNDWRGIGDKVFKSLWSINASVLVLEVNHVQSIASQWHCFCNELIPHEQAYFNPQSKLDKDLRKILKNIGMIITCAPTVLYKHLKDQEFNPAIVSVESVFEYYRQFNHLVIPCPIEETPFRSAETFCIFLKYLLVLKATEDGSFQYMFPIAPTDTPLLLTADSNLRAFKYSKQILHSSYSHLFRQSSSRFLHPILLNVCTKNYFATESNISFSVLNGIMLANFPQVLYEQEIVNNVNSCVVSTELLKQIWDCLCNDPIFCYYKECFVKSWALIPSSCEKLYKSTSQILPVMTLLSYQEAFHLLTSLGVPVFSTRFGNSPADYCLKITDFSRILCMLYCLHETENILSNLSDPHQTIPVLFKYFSNISFRNDRQSLVYITSLPLFETINGKFTSIASKTVYIWPQGFCSAGIEKWAPHTRIVFLKPNGHWSYLCDIESLGGCELDDKEIYTKIIFDVFHILTSDERKQHLMYIKNNIYSDVVFASQYANKKRKNVANHFLLRLKSLPCIESENGDLKTISFFSNHKIQIFNTFHQHFNFLPKEYQEEEWLEFFQGLGLRETVTYIEFKQFCEKLSCGKHEKIGRASNVLISYLFSKPAEEAWYGNDSYLAEIGNIPFVQVDPLIGLQWIKKSCDAPLFIQSQNIGLTKLNQAVIYDSASVVWTIKPVVTLPHTEVLRMKNDYYNLLRKFGITIRPFVDDVFKNLINVSKTGLADFSLFYKYKPQYEKARDSNSLDQVSIENVIEQSLKYLFENNANEHLMELSEYPCIPVSASRSPLGYYRPDITKPVLVKPLQVLRFISDECQSLFPYLHMLPPFMNGLGDLKVMGIFENFTIKTLQHMLQFMYERYHASRLNPNDAEHVRKGIIKLYELCGSCEHKKVINEIAPLYLPNEECKLVNSTDIFFIDFTRYRKITNSFLNCKYSIFRLPPESPSVSRQVVDRKCEKDICLCLPSNVRPQGLSLVCTEEIVNSSSCQKECHLLLRFKNFKAIVQSLENQDLLSKLLNGVVHDVTFFSVSFVQLISTMKIAVIVNLNCNVKIHSCLVDTIAVPYLLQNGENDCILFVDSEAKPSIDLFSDFAQHLCIEIARIHQVKLTSYLKAIPLVCDILKVQSDDDLPVLLIKYNMDNANILPITFESDDTPALGKPIPEQLKVLLYEGDINHIFNPEEWVGYEIEDGVIIFARVLYQLTQDQDNPLVFKYKILINDNEDGTGEKEVSALDLYKFMPPSFVQESSSQELVLSDTDSASANLRTLTDSLSLIELKRKVCHELKTIWELKDEEEKRKAIKRLYVKYHPDKATNKSLYEEAFKFLLRQIERLSEGLSLEDPEDTTESSNTVYRSKWNFYYSHWNTFVPTMSYDSRRSDSTRSAHQNHWENLHRFQQFQPAPQPEEAKRWLRQAESDLSAMNYLSSQPNMCCQVLFLAHEASEKALKAGMYELGGLHSDSLKTHGLVSHAIALSSKKGGEWSTLYELVSPMECYYLNSRFPNVYAIPKAPVDVCTLHEAQQMASNANKVVGLIRRFV